MLNLRAPQQLECVLLLEIIKEQKFVSSRPASEMIKANICIQIKR